MLWFGIDCSRGRRRPPGGRRVRPQGIDTGVGRCDESKTTHRSSTSGGDATLPASQTSGGDPNLKTPVAPPPRPVAAAGFNRWNDWFGPWQWRHAAAVSATAKEISQSPLG